MLPYFHYRAISYAKEQLAAGVHRARKSSSDYWDLFGEHKFDFNFYGNPQNCLYKKV